LPSWTISHHVCEIGTEGAYEWSGIPTPSEAQRFLWFLVVGDNGLTSATEGSWGLTSAGAERGGASPSGDCFTSKNSSGSCGTP
jgi:hypothetical protein